MENLYYIEYHGKKVAHTPKSLSHTPNSHLKTMDAPLSFLMATAKVQVQRIALICGEDHKIIRK